MTEYKTELGWTTIKVSRLNRVTKSHRLSASSVTKESTRRRVCITIYWYQYKMMDEWLGVKVNIATSKQVYRRPSRAQTVKVTHDISGSLIDSWWGSGRYLGYAELRVAHAPGMPGTFSPSPQLAIPTCITARASFMLNPNFDVSGKRPMHESTWEQKAPLNGASYSRCNHYHTVKTLWISAIILGMSLANMNGRYKVTLPLTGWANAKSDIRFLCYQ